MTAYDDAVDENAAIHGLTIPEQGARRKMKKVLHIIPNFGIGGVEEGIRRSYEDLNRNFSYHVFSIKTDGSAGTIPIGWISLLRMMRSRRTRPDIVITSLWPSHFIGLFFKILGFTWIPFFHVALEQTGIRKLAHRLAVSYGDVLISDSSATAKSLGVLDDRRTRICPYIFQDTQQTSAKPIQQRATHFIFVGRVHSQKRIDLLLKFLGHFSDHGVSFNCHFILAGEDHQIDAVVADIARDGLEIAVTRNASNEDVRAALADARFFLLLSDYEGFSLATIEAVQAGCVPIVRPVGEIPNYLQKDAAFWLVDDSEGELKRLFAKIMNHWDDMAGLEGMSALARSFALNESGYCETMKKIIIQSN
jgi:glycosyltransferase involved in cell wall biosynthesis